MKLSHESSRETHLEAADDDFDISGEFQKFSGFAYRGQVGGGVPLPAPRASES